MKKVLKTAAVLTAVIAISGTAYAQSFVGFANVGQPVLDSTTGGTLGAPATVGYYYSTDLGAPTDSFTLGGTAPILLNGLFTNAGQSLELPVSAGTVIAVEIRAWTGGFASYEEALAGGNPASDRVGVSGVLPMNLTTASASSPPPALIQQGGFTSFSVSPVPEPSTIALGILGGLGAMVLLRRRR